jgi:ATP-dependent Clp protease ATP-binding subunit ClpX
MQANSLGFKALSSDVEFTEDMYLQYAIPADVKQFGLIPEIIGRIPILTALQPLDAETLKAILLKPKNALIRQYIALFELEGIDLIIADEVIDYIVDKAIEFKLGARGLRSVCEAILSDYMFDAPSDKAIKEINIGLQEAQKVIERLRLRAA